MYNLVLIIFALLAFILSIYVLIFCCSNDKFGNTDMNKICCGIPNFKYYKSNNKCYKNLKPLCPQGFKYNKTNNICYKSAKSITCGDLNKVIIDGIPYCSEGILDKCSAMSSSDKSRCKKKCK